MTRADRWTCVFFFALVLVTQFNGKLRGGGDTRWYIPVALSLIEEGNTDLDEYVGIIGPGDYAVMRHEGHLYNFFPIGPSLVAIPIVYGLDRLGVHVLEMSVSDYIHRHNPWRIESLIAVTVVALAAVVMYRLTRLYLDLPRAALVTLVFLYATSTWSTASMALWMHGPSMLCLGLALYWLLRARQRPAFLYAAAVPLFFSFVIRPTNGAPVALLSLYVLLKHRRQFPLFLAIGFMSLIPLFLDSYAKSGRLLDHYYASGGTPYHHLSFEGLAGTLVSPGRGLFVYSPVLLLSIAGLWLKLHRRQLDSLDAALIGSVLIHWVSLSVAAMNWWGGHSYGPRYFTDLNPFFAYWLIPLLQTPRRTSWQRPAVAYAAIGLLSIIGAAIQWRGVHAVGPALWNAYPTNVNQRPERLWDWGDVPFLRGIQVVRYSPMPLSRSSLLFAPSKIDAPFGAMMALSGYDVPRRSATLGTGDALSVALYWRALRTPDADYSVFVHLVDEAGSKWSQDDQAPGASADYPPTRWRRGDVIYDRHMLDIPENLPPGTYYLEVGAYRWETGTRLTVPSREGQPQDHVRLAATIEVHVLPGNRTYVPIIVSH